MATFVHQGEASGAGRVGEDHGAQQGHRETFARFTERLQRLLSAHGLHNCGWYIH